jgi:hypothetical protein
MMPAHRFALAAFACPLVAACWAATPRPEDAHAPRDFYAQIHPPEAKCDRNIAMLPPGAMPGRAHKEVASLSASCSPGTIEVCEQRMKVRACELGADAVLLTEPGPGPNPVGASGQTLVSRSGRAIRWEP